MKELDLFGCSLGFEQQLLKALVEVVLDNLTELVAMYPFVLDVPYEQLLLFPFLGLTVVFLLPFVVPQDPVHVFLVLIVRALFLFAVVFLLVLSILVVEFHTLFSILEFVLVILAGSARVFP